MLLYSISAPARTDSTITAGGNRTRDGEPVPAEGHEGETIDRKRSCPAVSQICKLKGQTQPLSLSVMVLATYEPASEPEVSPAGQHQHPIGH
jgi:hypothetical protein